MLLSQADCRVLAELDRLIDAAPSIKQVAITVKMNKALDVLRNKAKFGPLYGAFGEVPLSADTYRKRKLVVIRPTRTAYRKTATQALPLESGK